MCEAKGQAFESLVGTQSGREREPSYSLFCLYSGSGFSRTGRLLRPRDRWGTAQGTLDTRTIIDWMGRALGA